MGGVFSPVSYRASVLDDIRLLLLTHAVFHRGWFLRLSFFVSFSAFLN